MVKQLKIVDSVEHCWVTFNLQLHCLLSSSYPGLTFILVTIVIIIIIIMIIIISIIIVIIIVVIIVILINLVERNLFPAPSSSHWTKTAQDE